MIAEFRSGLDVRELDDVKAVLLAPLIYASAHLDQIITVPAGFVTDFASVPRLPFVYWLVGGRGKKAAVVHDFLYQGHATTKREADRVFLEAMEASGLRLTLRYPMYWGVVLGGRRSYRTGPERMQRLNTGFRVVKAARVMFAVR